MGTISIFRQKEGWPVEREKTCCFTGHRPNKLPWGENEADPRCITLKEAIRREMERAYDRGFRHFISGMAMGCDLYFAEAALALREEYPEVDEIREVSATSILYAFEDRQVDGAVMDIARAFQLPQYNYTRVCDQDYVSYCLVVRDDITGTDQFQTFLT